MNKLFLIAVFLFGLLLSCGGLNNPFDENSPNYVSDTTLVRVLHSYDSTFIDTSVFFDTVVHVYNLFHDSVRIVSQVHFDTSFVIDTLIDSLLFRDTVFFLDTIIYYDSVGYIDTLHLRDTLFFWDSLFHYDSLVHIDSSHFRDTLHLRDTVVFADTVHFRDTIHFRDTLCLYDTLLHLDTLFFLDTTHFRDTLCLYDTLVHLVTVIDTIRFYRTQPFIYLIKLPDSSIFNTFNYGVAYNLLFKAAGINPAIIHGYSFKAEGGAVWNSVTLPWSRTFSTTSPVFYTLRIDTDSGAFANSYTLRCDPTSAIRGSRPAMSQVLISTLRGYQRTFSGYAPVCTLWTDSAIFTPFPDRIETVSITPEFSISGGTVFDYYISKTGSYDTASCDFNPGASAQSETTLDGITPGTHLMTCLCRSVSPDTSLWSTWTTFVFVVRDGR
jgi:hypothetical protein